MNDTDYELDAKTYQDQIKNLKAVLKENPLAKKWLIANLVASGLITNAKSALVNDENDFEIQTRIEQALNELSL